MLMRFKNRKKAVLFRLFIVIAVIGLVTAANASNPLITSIYTADADCLVANNAFYVYCGRDEAAAGQQAFVMDEWHILKSTDMQNWTDLGVKLSLSNFSWANANAWAGSVCYKNGKYWWYVPVNDRATNAMAIGVASSTSPEGPFTDALGRALITNQTPNCNIFNIDPGVFVDDDGQAYLYWGGYWAVRAVKLNDDMISFSGTPVQPSGIPTSGTTRYWEAPTLRKYNGLYYFSYAANQNPATIEYCTATNPMGPWTYRGRILDTTTPTGTNHHSYNQTPFGGRYFCVYHTSPAGDDYHRRVNCDEMYYNADGTIRKVVQTSAGPSPVTGNPTPTPTRRGATPTPTRAVPTPTGSSGPIVWYKFDGNTSDSSGNNKTATLYGSPTYTAGRQDSAINLSGSSQYVGMPSGIVSGLTNFTIATWVRLDTISTWSRIFDIGTGTTVNMFLTPRGGSNVIRFAITTGGYSAEQQINGAAALPTGVWKHVAVTKSGNVAILYVDGVEVGRNSNMTLSPSNLGNTGNNYIGKSQYADPYLDGQIDNFRIYNRALSASEVSSLYSAGN
ncbi:MAG: family 43 glycosylhydrolase [Firmicutes bacterium]|nr:family 43 glycosylhydrolase [Bacillota bacterium]